MDSNTVLKVARLSGVGPGDKVVEVGAGLGALTLALVATGAEVVAVEVDRRLLAALREVLEEFSPADAGRPSVRLVEGDALALDWAGLLGEGAWTLVANLPYNIATPLVVRLLDEVPAISRMLVMIQKEVGDRLAASPGSPAYGAVSVKVAYWASAQLVARVPPTVFWPQPKVDSALIDIRRRATPIGKADKEWMFRLVTAGFGQRRKMLRRSLAGMVTAEQLTGAGIRPDARAEELNLADWAGLAVSTRP